jgi:DNA-binding helix-hairpin-helix protein with protein kinase domain
MAQLIADLQKDRSEMITRERETLNRVTDLLEELIKSVGRVEVIAREQSIKHAGELQSVMKQQALFMAQILETQTGNASKLDALHFRFDHYFQEERHDRASSVLGEK